MRKAMMCLGWLTFTFAAAATPAGRPLFIDIVQTWDARTGQLTCSVLRPWDFIEEGADIEFAADLQTGGYAVAEKKGGEATLVDAGATRDRWVIDHGKKKKAKGKRGPNATNLRGLWSYSVTVYDLGADPRDPKDDVAVCRIDPVICVKPPTFFAREGAEAAIAADLASFAPQQAAQCE